MSALRKAAARESILRLARDGGKNIAKQIQEKHGVSRTTANRYIESLIEDQSIERHGHGRYRLVSHSSHIIYEIAGLEEHQVWQDDLLPPLTGLAENVETIWEYGCTEMINNAIDHSEGNSVTVKITRTALAATVTVYDDGIGIFKKIADALSLEDERQSVLELAKGKFTTDPENHTGQGIFFTCRSMEQFSIYSRGVRFSHELGDDVDWVVGQDYGSPDTSTRGTMVMMQQSNDSKTDIGDVFSKHEGEDWSFDRTIVPVRLLAVGENRLVSRSQAKRLLGRFDKFKEVVLDFEGVESVGQGFADEVFRVFKNRHPNIELIPIRQNEAVGRMISRALAQDIERATERKS